MTADQGTAEGWLRKMEKAADEHEPGDTYRALVFRQIIAAAWTDGHMRGYDDSSNDQGRADASVRRAAREATPPTPEGNR